MGYIFLCIFTYTFNNKKPHINKPKTLTKQQNNNKTAHTHKTKTKFTEAFFQTLEYEQDEDNDKLQQNKLKYFS